MVNVLIWAIILIPVVFFIFKGCREKWVNLENQRLENDIDKQIKNLQSISSAYNRVRNIDLDKVKEKKEKIEEVKKI